jgi:hypothetical protein
VFGLAVRVAPLDEVAEVLVSPARIRPCFPGADHGQRLGGLLGATVRDVAVVAQDSAIPWITPVRRIHGGLTTQTAVVHAVLVGTREFRGHLGALAVGSTALATIRWMLAANDVIGSEWTPSELRMRASVRRAIELAEELV